MTTGVLNAEDLRALVLTVWVRRIVRLLLAAFVAPFYVLGWLAGRAVHLTALAVTAVRVGWRDGHTTTTHDRSDAPTARSPASRGDQW